jgi:hypothetical protein
MHEQPSHAADVYVVRIGQPEKPWRATYDYPESAFQPDDVDPPRFVSIDLVLKWRLQEL